MGLNKIAALDVGPILSYCQAFLPVYPKMSNRISFALTSELAAAIIIKIKGMFCATQIVKVSVGPYRSQGLRITAGSLGFERGNDEKELFFYM